MKHITEPLTTVASKLVKEAREANTKESLEFVDCVERLNKTKEDVMDDKKIVIEKQYTLTDVACYQYPCARCGHTEILPQIIVKTFGKLAPDGWCCVAQDDERSYYCDECSIDMGIGV